MCMIENIRRSSRNIYLTINEDDIISVKKLSIAKYEYAKQFGNSDFLNAVSTLTTERDIEDSYSAVTI